MHSHVLPDPAVHRKLFGTMVGAGLWAVLSGVLTVIISVIQKSACKLTFPQQECVCLVRSGCLLLTRLLVRLGHCWLEGL